MARVGCNIARAAGRPGAGLGLLFGVAVAAVVLGVFRPVLDAGAVSFDDRNYLFENPTLQNPSWAAARTVFREVLRSPDVEGYYEPLTLASLMLDVAAGGRRDNLRPFHRTSLALHAANVVLVFLLLHSLFAQVWPVAWVGRIDEAVAEFRQGLSVLPGEPSLEQGLASATEQKR